MTDREQFEAWFESESGYSEYAREMCWRAWNARAARAAPAHETRAQKLERQGKPFFVVKASEPYARQVVALIKAHEGANWTDTDEAWANSVLSAAPAQPEEKK